MVLSSAFRGAALSRRRQTLLHLAPDHGPIADAIHTGLAKLLGVEEPRIPRTTRLERVACPTVRLFDRPTLDGIAKELEQYPDPDTEKRANISADNDHRHAQQPIHSANPTAISSWFIRGSDIVIPKPQPRLLCIYPMTSDASFFTPYLIEPTRGLEPVLVKSPDTISKTLDGPTHLSCFPRQGNEATWSPSSTAFIRHRYHCSSSVAHWQKGASGRREQHLPPVFARDIGPDYAIAVSQDPDFLRSILPLLKSDAPWFMDYACAEGAPIKMPITALAARQDDVVYPDQVVACNLQADEFEFQKADGGHWLIHRNRQLNRERRIVPLPNLLE
ncbi:hypothetical protein FQN49_000915 [Arthroderma sp. PD_2]|nr:hypothetical protein FQN49_000915 [Arthroderma sp. PD_2]